jgi:hypothetical protein
MHSINDSKTESLTMTSDSTSESKSSYISDQIYALLCALIEQAVNDYRQLEKAGYIDHGRITSLADRLTAKKTALGMTRKDLQELIHFLHSPAFDRLCLNGLRIELDPVAVRDRLGFPSQRGGHEDGE